MTVVGANLSADAKQRKIDAKHSPWLAHTLSYIALLYFLHGVVLCFAGAQLTATQAGVFVFVLTT